MGISESLIGLDNDIYFDTSNGKLNEFYYGIGNDRELAKEQEGILSNMWPDLKEILQQSLDSNKLLLDFGGQPFISDVEVKLNFLKTYKIRPWGYWYDHHRTKEHVLKTMVVKPGKKLSLQYHHKRSEIWKIIKGLGQVYQEVPGKDFDGRGVTLTAYPNDTFEIGLGDIHRLGNIGNEDLEVLELQIGECSEEDIVRIEI